MAIKNAASTTFGGLLGILGFIFATPFILVAVVLGTIGLYAVMH